MAGNEVELRARVVRPTRRPMPGPGYVRPFGLEPRPVGPLESWAHLDPTGLAPRLVRVARLVPGVSSVEQRIVAPLEERLLRIAFARARLVLPPSAGGPVPRVVPEEPPAGDPLAAAMLARLVPDEVLVLGTLAEGQTFPLVHVTATRRDDDTAVLTNASTVGRAAGVARPDRTPAYVTNLVHLGLARIGPRDDGLRARYDDLLADEAVVAACTEAAGRRRFGKARIERRTVRVTDFGRELWQAHQPFDDPFDDRRGGQTREDR